MNANIIDRQELIETVLAADDPSLEAIAVIGLMVAVITEIHGSRQSTKLLRVILDLNERFPLKKPSRAELDAFIRECVS